jgi:hypothetical protein
MVDDFYDTKMGRQQAVVNGGLTNTAIGLTKKKCIMHMVFIPVNPNPLSIKPKYHFVNQAGVCLYIT